MWCVLNCFVSGQGHCAADLHRWHPLASVSVGKYRQCCMWWTVVAKLCFPMDSDKDFILSVKMQLAGWTKWQWKHFYNEWMNASVSIDWNCTLCVYRYNIFVQSVSWSSGRADTRLTTSSSCSYCSLVIPLLSRRSLGRLDHLTAVCRSTERSHYTASSQLTCQSVSPLFSALCCYVCFISDKEILYF